MSPVRVTRLADLDAEFYREVVAEEVAPGSRVSQVARVVKRLSCRIYRARLFALILLLIGVFGLLVTLGVSHTARAVEVNPLNDWCTPSGRIPGLNTERPDNSFISFGATLDANGTRPQTTWAQYGTAGIEWNAFWLRCTDWGDWVNNKIYTLWFRFLVFISASVISFFQWVIDGSIVNVFIGDQPGTKQAALDAVVHALHLQLFLGLAGAATIIGALVLVWKGLLKNAGFGDIMGKIALMAIVFGLALYAATGSNASSALRTFNDFSNEVTVSTFAAFANATCEVNVATAKKCQTTTTGKKQIPCTNSDPDNPVVQASPGNCFAQVMYHSLIYVPWAQGEVGSLTPGSPSFTIKDGDKPDEKIVNRQRLAYAILQFQAYSRDEVAKGVPEFRLSDNDLDIVSHGRATQLKKVMEAFDKNGKDKNGKDYNYIENFLYADPDPPNGGVDNYKEPRSDLLYLKELYWMSHSSDRKVGGLCRKFGPACDFGKKILDNAQDTVGGGEPWNEFNNIYNLIDPDMKPVFDIFSGHHEGQRYNVFWITLLVSLPMWAMLIAIAMGYLVLQIASVAFAALAPLAFLVGLVPGAGFKALLKWAELFLGTFLKRIGLGVFVGFIMTIYVMVLNLPFHWMLQVALLLGVAFVGFSYRRKVMEMAGVGGVGQAVSRLMPGGGGMRNSVRGFRLWRTRYKAGMDASEGLVGRGGPVGGIRRRFAAFRGSLGSTRFYEQKRQARAMGRSNIHTIKNRKGWDTPTRHNQRLDFETRLGQQGIPITSLPRQQRDRLEKLRDKRDVKKMDAYLARIERRHARAARRR